jgi:hypothetical protein
MQKGDFEQQIDRASKGDYQGAKKVKTIPISASEAMYPNGPKEELGNEDKRKWAFRDKLLANVDTRNLIYRYAEAEVGNQGPKAKQAFIEQATNMAASQGKPVEEVLQARNPYFPDITHSRANRPLSEAKQAEYEALGQSVREGSNVCNYCTGNASGTVRFGGGPTTAIHGDERFGVENNSKSVKWAKDMGYSGDLPIPTSDRPEGVADTEGGGEPGRRKTMQEIREKQGRSLLNQEEEEPFKPNIPKFQVPDLSVKFTEGIQ